MLSIDSAPLVAAPAVDPRAPRVLVFDSGLGGLTVLGEVVRALPGAEFVYAADDVVFPYGLLAEDALIGMLRQLALYVQTVVQGIADPAQSMAALLSSGFEAVSNNRSQSPLDAPKIIDIQNVGAGRLKLVIGAVSNARMYEAQRKDGTGDWVSAGLFANSRGIVVTGLTPGTNYTFRVRAMGGSTGQSDWSNPVSHMSL